ncbi:MAG: GntR family transcriptional regulator [Hyphomonadaceae bacterium]|nr:GntR family transcriptional regulator [Hyphomonadaceae bacterium]
MSCGQPHMIPLPVVGDQSQTSRLADELATAIHLGQLAPGAPLREVEIAESHGVSRTIVRAALQRLEAQGLAEIVLNKGARVRVVEAGSVDDMIELHVELTALAARQAAARATPAQLARIDQFVDMMEHVAEEAGSPQEFQHLRVGFARALFEAAGPVLAERLRSAAPVAPHHARAMEDVRDQAGQEEAAGLARDLLKAIEARSAEAAAKAAEKLLRRHADRTQAKPVKAPARTKARRAA